eukprot:7189584-Pyramimonas_sp.AAC.1
MPGIDDSLPKPTPPCDGSGLGPSDDDSSECCPRCRICLARPLSPGNKSRGVGNNTLPASSLLLRFQSRMCR